MKEYELLDLMDVLPTESVVAKACIADSIIVIKVQKRTLRAGTGTKSVKRFVFQIPSSKVVKASSISSRRS